MNFFWGSTYEGNFDSVENFSNGVLTVLNGDRFYGDWVGGKLKSGKLITQSGKTRMINDKNKKILNYDRDTGYGVIIKYDSNSIYEGRGIRLAGLKLVDWSYFIKNFNHIENKLFSPFYLLIRVSYNYEHKIGNLLIK